MKIYAPVKSANGIYASVRFVNGVGETDNPGLIEWFRNHGYGIEFEVPNDTLTDFAKNIIEQSDEPDFESMTPNDLRDWMREHGYGSKIKNTKSKDKLLEILRG